MRYFWATILAASVCLGADLESASEPREGFQWAPALAQSALFLSVQHGVRFTTEPGTRAALQGPFLRDYWRSATGVRGWGDGDPFIVNYVGHPFQGAVSGYIQVQNDPGFRRAEFGASEVYWKSRLRATGFAALYSVQFELGPLSEASLGNVGYDRKSSGAVDLVVTPAAGAGVMLAEDALDRYFIRRAENWSRNAAYRIVVRSMLNPNRSFANLLRFKVPWHRDTRGGIREP